MEKKEKKTSSIKLKLIGIIMPVVICSIVILILNAYNQSREIITHSATQLLATSTKNQADQIKAWLDENLASFQAAKEAMEGTDGSETALQNILDRYYGYHSNYPNGLYIADENGTVLTAKGAEDYQGKDVKETIWYQEGQTRIRMAYGSPYQNAQGKHVISASAMLTAKGGKAKILSVDLSLDKISVIVNSKIEMEGARAFLVDREDGTILAHRESNLISTKLKDSSDLFLRQVAEKIENKDYESTEFDGMMLTMEKVSGTDWILVSYIQKSAILSELTKLRNFMIGVAVISLTLLIVIIERVVHIVIKPIKKITDTIVTMSNGDFTIDLFVKGNDEIAVMSKSLKQFIEVMRTMLKDMGEISEQLHGQAKDSSNISEEMFDASKQQSASMEQLNVTVDDLTHSVNELADNATVLADVVNATNKEGSIVDTKMKETVSVSEQGKKDMENVGITMKNIEHFISELEEAVNHVGNASEEITGIINVIGEIAEETKLLSLNASIEAARAGETGRGFAVVASEIGKLAANSSKSVQTIEALICEITNLVGNAVNQAKESGKYIRNSSEMIKTAVDTFDTIFDTIHITSSRVQTMILKISEVDDVASSMAAISEEQAASSEEILASCETMVTKSEQITENSELVAEGAGQLMSTAERLKTHVEYFKIGGTI